MQRIGIIGTGTMATGIAQNAAQCGYDVVVRGRSQDSVDKCTAGVKKALDRMVAKEKITQAAADETLGHIQGTLALEDLKSCDLVIESVAEDLEVKRELLEKVDALLEDDTILATNTSSLSVTKLASLTNRPAQFIGMHFFNPVPMMKLVEVVSGLRTSDATVATVRELAEKLGKVPVEVKDAPGFVVNRVLFPMINEAAFALGEGVSTAEGIDECMKFGCNHPMGPLALADLVGLDVVHAILTSLHREYGNPRYAPCLEITKRLEAGWLGRKAGRGFYDYSG
ncbi:MAG: 3-hydroxyacyl-CoA dehydrogenase NAD-binding domain-containing protein [Proteobacteria bacterium]|nr:3-hydroxyacyl-CoA dehydrogenase NAD-binding domain-containing protein [Pseudomonadota bacterium]